MSTPQAKNGAALPFHRLSFDTDGENQMSTSDRAPLFPQVPDYVEDPEYGAYSIRQLWFITELRQAQNCKPSQGMMLYCLSLTMSLSLKSTCRFLQTLRMLPGSTLTQ
ncbi:hypothetical protein DER46DRAFT_79760 [Fusarium sp. MPI-SDFR-AT-0072]|nr:hypothetical protein DER46DRAFT_79760 [Fusarium sp. MPI-SDFR-AT-0072]